MNANDGNPIPVVVAGALGRMGMEVIKAINSSSDCELVGAVETVSCNEGHDVGLEIGLESLDVQLTSDFEGCLCSASQEANKDISKGGVVLIDFTHPSVVYEHTRAAILNASVPQRHARTASLSVACGSEACWTSDLERQVALMC